MPDRNGPWLSERLHQRGIDLAHILVCGDRPDDLVSALRFMQAEDCGLIVTSGGLGPTADDLTAEVVARFAGREMFLDTEVERRIEEILARFAKRWRNLDMEAVRAANRKQAMVPEGATVLGPAGTAPGLVVPADGTTVVVLPGPPRELHALWDEAVETEAFAAAVTDATAFEQRMLRLFGIPESEIAETLRVAAEDVELDRLEITTCLRRAEIEIVTRYEPHDAETYEALVAVIRERHPNTLFSEDGALIDDQVAELLRGHRIATAESCTAGLLAARLTERPGSSDYVAGGVIAYSNEAKVELLGVDPTLIERHGAVSTAVAEAMAEGALERFGADIAVAITGIAGPGGGTEEKPVGRICLTVAQREGQRCSRSLDLPGDRTEVRDRSTTVALHLLRRLLRGEEPPV